MAARLTALAGSSSAGNLSVFFFAPWKGRITLKSRCSAPGTSLQQWGAKKNHHRPIVPLKRGQNVEVSRNRPEKNALKRENAHKRGKLASRFQLREWPRLFPMDSLSFSPFLSIQSLPFFHSQGKGRGYRCWTGFTYGRSTSDRKIIWKKICVQPSTWGESVVGVHRRVWRVSVLHVEDPGSPKSIWKKKRAHPLSSSLSHPRWPNRLPESHRMAWWV